MKKKSIVWFLLVIFSVILVLASVLFIIVFIFNFWRTPLSSDMTDWGEFGSYISCITSLLNLVFFVVLTQKAFEFEKSSSERQASFQETTFKQQMQSQKLELETAFRKSHIDDIRKIMFDFDNITRYEIKKVDGFKKFKRECSYLKRIFEIYDSNKMNILFENCSYENINKQFSGLMDYVNSINTTHLTTDKECNDIWEYLNNINHEMIKLEKNLSLYTLAEFEKVFDCTGQTN